jgi:signal transduction histidine kinase
MLPAAPADPSPPPGLAAGPPPRRPAAALLGRPRSIRARLGRILALSLTMMLVLLGILLARKVGEYRSAASTAGTVRLTLQVQDAIHMMQRERGLSVGLVGGDTRFRVPVRNARKQTDAALTALRGALSDRRDDEATAVQNALGPLADLAAVRGGVDDRTAERAPTFGFYTDAIAALNNLDLGLNQAQDTALRQGLQALYALGDHKEYTGQERAILNGVFSAGRFGDGDYLKFADIRGGRSAALAQFNRFATVEQRGRLDAVRRSTPATVTSRLEAVAIGSPAGRLTQPVDPVQWYTQMTAVIDQMRTVQQSIGADITGRASELQQSAASALIAYLLLAALEMAAEILLVVAATRSVSGPLRALSREADDVATRRLPEVVAALQSTDEEHRPTVTPVTAPPRAGAEVRSVALALDRLQSTAMALAGEQAVVRRNTIESLANLGRRNQNLVRRQLGLISEFEREELDPSALANLFELDHLATRMRRNAESLLVLVGRSSPRQWSEPLPVTDVVRAGVSEVEDYRRVMLRRVDDTLINGSVVNEVAHMLAELIENGLSFSPPDVDVEIYGRRVGQRYLLVVVDQGVGMSSDMLAKANARLRGDEDFIVAPTRFLGHYVVGRLAQRLGAEVELSASPVTGITARVVLPPEVLAEPGSDAQPGSGRSGKAIGEPLAPHPVVSLQPEAAVEPVVAPHPVVIPQAEPEAIPQPEVPVPAAALEPRLESATEPPLGSSTAANSTGPSYGNGHRPRRPGRRPLPRPPLPRRPPRCRRSRHRQPRHRQPRHRGGPCRRCRPRRCHPRRAAAPSRGQHRRPRWRRAVRRSARPLPPRVGRRRLRRPSCRPDRRRPVRLANRLARTEPASPPARSAPATGWSSGSGAPARHRSPTGSAPRRPTGPNPSSRPSAPRRRSA